MHRLIVLALGSFALLCLTNTFAQTYPTRPVRVIVPFPPRR